MGQGLRNTKAPFHNLPVNNIRYKHFVNELNGHKFSQRCANSARAWIIHFFSRLSDKLYHRKTASMTILFLRQVQQQD